MYGEFKLNHESERKQSVGVKLSKQNIMACKMKPYEATHIEL